MSEKKDALSKFIENMRKAVEGLRESIYEDNLGGKVSFSGTVLEKALVTDIQGNYELLCQMLMELCEIDVATFDGKTLSVKTTSEYANYPEGFIDESFKQEIEMACARHTLWIYDDNDGERADFSEKVIYNVDFSGKNLSGAIFNETTFRNCNFSNAVLSKCDFYRANFDKCNLNDVVAENANFSSAYFLKCNMSNASLEHGKFESAIIDGCDMYHASATDSYIKGLEVHTEDVFNECFDFCTTDLNEYEGGMKME